MALRLIFLLCFLILASAAPGRKLVATHPGFDGALSFSLETGYETVDDESGVELFDYFIQSESDTSSDPVLLCLNGGDRCSVFSVIAYEIGPIKFIIEPYNGSIPQLRYNPNYDQGCKHPVR